MKKISFVNYSLGNGGAERVMSLIANYCAVNSNMEIQIITMDELVSYNLEKQVKHITIKRTVKRHFFIKEFMPKCRKLIKESDVVISFLWNMNIFTIITSFFLKKRIIVSDRNDTKKEIQEAFKNPLSRIFFKWLLKFLYRFPTKIVFQTPEVQKFYSNYVQKKSIIIPNPITPNLPDRYHGERRKEIVAMCRLEPQKNIKMMINAFALLVKDYPDFILTIYGEGNLREELQNYINDVHLKEKIFLPGRITDIHNKVVDSYMYISSSDFEGISNSMLEALGMGLPSVVTDCPVGGARMFIQNYENGILVPVGDVQAMYEGMKKIIEDDAFREKISENAVKIKNELSVDIICKKWLDLIEDK